MLRMFLMRYQENHENCGQKCCHKKIFVDFPLNKILGVLKEHLFIEVDWMLPYVTINQEQRKGEKYGKN